MDGGMEINEDQPMRKTKAIRSELARAQEPTTNTCISAEKRQ